MRSLQLILPYLLADILILISLGYSFPEITLENHRHRLVNYNYYQAENIAAIALGAVESTVKQIDRRLKISGAQ